MKKLMLLPLLLIPTVSHAEGYLDVGLALAHSPYVYKVESTCDYVGDRWTCARDRSMVTGVMGTVELGYTSGSYTAYYSHTSIINKSDGPGLNMIGVKKRFNLF